MKQHPISNLWSIIRYSSPKIVEIGLFLAFVFCAVVLYVNQNLFQGVTYQHIWCKNEWVWATMFIVLATIKIFGIAYDKELIRKTVCWLGTGIWVYLEIIVIGSPTFGLITAFFTLCTVMQVYVFTRINYE